MPLFIHIIQSLSIQGIANQSYFPRYITLNLSTLKSNKSLDHSLNNTISDLILLILSCVDAELSTFVSSAKIKNFACKILINVIYK